MRRSPSATLFPYTTLFRSNSYGSRRGNHEVMVRGTFANVRLNNLLAPGTRSEEHTSELQSLTKIVCRLLLEKKNARRWKRLVPKRRCYGWIPRSARATCPG